MGANEENYQQNVNRELSLPDWEEKEAEQEALVDSPIELEMFQWKPEAEKEYPEINKDRVGGNLSDSEMFSISMNEELHNSIIGMRASVTTNMPFADEDNEKISKFFFPDDLLKAPLRRISSMLALSLSKEGFWRKLSRTRVIQKGFNYSDPTQDVGKNLDWMPFNFLKKKKKSQSQENY